MLTASDLPSAETCLAQAITRVVYVVADRRVVDHEEDDLNDLFRSYADAGIQIDIVDLAWLCDDSVAAHGSGWWVRLDGCHLSVVRRRTVVHDERFYARARGGFGGAHARPYVMAHPFVGGFSGGSGGVHGGGHGQGGAHGFGGG